jgi:ribose transport system substrate-binding protein
LIEGMAGVYAAVQRTAGFKETIAAEGKGFEVVASVPGDWDRQKSYDAATNTLNHAVGRFIHLPLSR